MRGNGHICSQHPAVVMPHSTHKKSIHDAQPRKLCTPEKHCRAASCTKQGDCWPTVNYATPSDNSAVSKSTTHSTAAVGSGLLATALCYSTRFKVLLRLSAAPAVLQLHALLGYCWLLVPWLYERVHLCHVHDRPPAQSSRDAGATSTSVKAMTWGRARNEENLDSLTVGNSCMPVSCSMLT